MHQGGSDDPPARSSRWLASAVLVLAACSSGGSTASSGGGTASSPGVASTAASVCKETADAGAVAVKIIDFAFQPSDVTATTGQVIAFSNTGTTGHTATLDGGGCATSTIDAGKSDGLVFSVAGTYKFHCAIHPTQMTGTIVVS
ncbi:MAG TPA: cupredoxin domain-containing protein [Candidatus Limnocylindrales bacterium]